MKPPSGFSPLLGLIAALLLMIAGIAAALTHDDTTKTTTTSIDEVTTRPSLPRSPTGSGAGASEAPTSTITTLPTTTTASTTTTTVKPAVPTPEAAANGLWAAYTTGDRSAALRFATREVVDALFSEPYSGEEGKFESCHKRSQSIFDCRYAQPSVEYTMTAVSDATGNFQIKVISSAPTATTTTTASSASS